MTNTKPNSSQITYDSGPNKQDLNSILDTIVPIEDYAALRLYNGRATQIRIIDPSIAGFFYCDTADTTSNDDGKTIIKQGASIDSDGTIVQGSIANAKRWKRVDGYISAEFEDMNNVRDATLKFALDQAALANRSAVSVSGRVGKVESLAAWDYERQAEVLRGLGQSGFFLTRQYTRGGPDSFNRPFTVSYSPTNIHNHPNYAGMPGMGEFSAIVNGYYLRSRHNDYRLRKPAAVGSSFLATEELMAPAVPVSVTGLSSVSNQITKMRELFQRFDKGEWPEGFGWTMSYVEMWFEVYSQDVSDTFDSFRHQQYVTTVDAALREALKFNYGGYKDPTENLTFETPVVRAIDSDGNPVLGRLRYRIAAVDVSSLGDLRPHIEMYDDWGNLKHRAAQPNRFRVRNAMNAPGKLDDMMSLIPGLDGDGAVLNEQYGAVTLGEYADTLPLNAAYYSRFAAGMTDASNRSNFRRGFNDPMLFVARTTRTNVAPVKVNGVDFRFSYAIPLELILRTPLERWNPYNAPEKTLAQITGNGLQSTPYNGWSPELRNFHTPSDFFGSTLTLTQTDQADSGTSGSFVTTPSGVVQMRASGIYVSLPGIDGVANTVRTRYPIYPVYHEGSHAYAQAEAMQIEMNVMRGKADIALDQASLAHRSLHSLRNQAMQEGVVRIKNRGVISGCAITKSTSAARNVNFSGGTFYAFGRIYFVPAQENAAYVPGNTGAGSETVYAYLIQNSDKTWDVQVNEIGSEVPDAAVILYSLTIPSGSSGSTDEYLSGVVLTPVITTQENEFPKWFKSAPTETVAINNLSSNAYSISFDIESYVGVPCSTDQIIVTSRATNGFTVALASAADDVVLRWKISKLDN